MSALEIFFPTLSVAAFLVFLDFTAAQYGNGRRYRNSFQPTYARSLPLVRRQAFWDRDRAELMAYPSYADYNEEGSLYRRYPRGRSYMEPSKLSEAERSRDDDEAYRYYGRLQNTNRNRRPVLARARPSYKKNSMSPTRGPSLQRAKFQPKTYRFQKPPPSPLDESPDDSREEFGFGRSEYEYPREHRFNSKTNGYFPRGSEFRSKRESSDAFGLGAESRLGTMEPDFEPAVLRPIRSQSLRSPPLNMVPVRSSSRSIQAQTPMPETSFQQSADMYLDRWVEGLEAGLRQRWAIPEETAEESGDTEVEVKAITEPTRERETEMPAASTEMEEEEENFEPEVIETHTSAVVDGKKQEAPELPPYKETRVPAPAIRPPQRGPQFKVEWRRLGSEPVSTFDIISDLRNLLDSITGQMDVNQSALETSSTEPSPELRPIDTYKMDKESETEVLGKLIPVKLDRMTPAPESAAVMTEPSADGSSDFFDNNRFMKRKQSSPNRDQDEGSKASAAKVQSSQQAALPSNPTKIHPADVKVAARSDSERIVLDIPVNVASPESLLPTAVESFHLTPADSADVSKSAQIREYSNSFPAESESKSEASVLRGGSTKKFKRSAKFDTMSDLSSFILNTRVGDLTEFKENSPEKERRTFPCSVNTPAGREACGTICQKQGMSVICRGPTCSCFKEPKDRSADNERNSGKCGPNTNFGRASCRVLCKGPDDLVTCSEINCYCNRHKNVNKGNPEQDGLGRLLYGGVGEFFYCGPANGINHCSDICRGWGHVSCGELSCYCDRGGS